MCWVLCKSCLTISFNSLSLFFYLFRAALVAYGSSQARGLIGAAAATGLCHSHSNARSMPHLQPTPQLMATPDPQPTERGQGWNPRPHGCQSGLPTAEPQRELQHTSIRRERGRWEEKEVIGEIFSTKYFPCVVWVNAQDFYVYNMVQENLLWYQ